jgi:hypothetical protein
MPSIDRRHHALFSNRPFGLPGAVCQQRDEGSSKWCWHEAWRKKLQLNRAQGLVMATVPALKRPSWSIYFRSLSAEQGARATAFANLALNLESDRKVPLSNLNYKATLIISQSTPCIRGGGTMVKYRVTGTDKSLSFYSLANLGW